MIAILLLAGAALFRVDPIPADVVRSMVGVSWHEGCPVALADLRQLTVAYWDYSSRKQQGVLIVHKDIADEARGLFRKLYDHHFLIEKMAPIDTYGGNDDASMAANNTSAFNCRDTTGRPGVFSNHSWGLAIDINPLTNPYVKGETVLPPAGRAYLDRARSFPGSILADGYVVKIFEAAGWTWGGRWKDRQDYQHFEKPARK
jgi:hypothetical protein